MESSGPMLHVAGSPRRSSINLLHLRCLVGGTLHFLQWWQIVIITQAFIVVVDAQSKLDHAMDAASKLSWLVQVETRGQQGSVKEQPNQIFHCLVGLICCCLLLQLGHPM